MRLSPLQKFILRTCYTTPPRIVPRIGFARFYDNQKVKPDDLINIITKSLEALIDRGLLTGYGVRTPKKWFIKEVKLTAVGRREAKALFGQQQPLPLKLNRRK